MSFFNLNSSCIFVCHFINCFNCCIYEWHSWLGNLKKIEVGEQGCSIKSHYEIGANHLTWKGGGGIWYYGKVTLFWVFPWKLLELSRNRRNFNIITNYTQSYIQLFPIQSHSLVKENSMKGNIHFFLFRCYGNQASLLNL